MFVSKCMGVVCILNDYSSVSGLELATLLPSLFPKNVRINSNISDFRQMTTKLRTIPSSTSTPTTTLRRSQTRLYGGWSTPILLFSWHRNVNMKLCKYDRNVNMKFGPQAYLPLEIPHLHLNMPGHLSYILRKTSWTEIYLNYTAFSWRVFIKLLTLICRVMAFYLSLNGRILYRLNICTFYHWVCLQTS